MSGPLSTISHPLCVFVCRRMAFFPSSFCYVDNDDGVYFRCIYFCCCHWIHLVRHQLNWNYFFVVVVAYVNVKILKRKQPKQLRAQKNQLPYDKRKKKRQLIVAIAGFSFTSSVRSFYFFSVVFFVRFLVSMHTQNVIENDCAWHQNDELHAIHFVILPIKLQSICILCAPHYLSSDLISSSTTFHFVHFQLNAVAIWVVAWAARFRHVFAFPAPKQKPLGSESLSTSRRLSDKTFQCHRMNASFHIYAETKTNEN